MKSIPNTEILRTFYTYDDIRGTLIQKDKGCNGFQKPGVESRGTGKDKRIVVIIKGVKFRHARVVWAFHYGDPGEVLIDHINGNTLDDRIENLRIATISQNAANRKNSKGYYAKGEKWRVDVMKDGKHHHGGTYNTEEEARTTAKKLKVTLFGEFSPYESRVSISGSDVEYEA